MLTLAVIVIYTTYGIQYQQVCGRVRGYQYRSPDAFSVSCPHPCTIDNVYVDGISITHGSPREHIWTYAAGITETYAGVCPCTGTGWFSLAQNAQSSYTSMYN